MRFYDCFEKIPFEHSILVSLRKALRLFPRLCYKSSNDRLAKLSQDQSVRSLSMNCLEKDFLLKMEGSDPQAVRQVLRSDLRFLKLLSLQMKQGETFWDIGANVGLYTLILGLTQKEKSISIAAFEPEKRTFETLEHNIGFNALENVKAWNVALGAREGEGVLRTAENIALGTNTLLERGKYSSTPLAQTVKVETGDGLILKHSLLVPSVIKIDTEGSEYEVLKGMLGILKNSVCHTVLCEVHFSMLGHDTPQKMLRLLRECGFDSKRWADPSHVLLTK